MDPYQILGVSRDASAAEVKKSYRKLAQKWHPDKNAGDKKAEEKFKEVKEAYERITQPEKFSNESFSGDPFAGMHDASVINDIFENIFGRGFNQRPNAVRGQNYSASVRLTFEESCFGCDKTIEFDVRENCNTCKGVGATEGNYTACGKCEGTGRVYQRQGLMRLAVPCHDCQGSGVKIQKACGDCSGTGQVYNHRKHDISIPPLRSTGNQLRIRGGGENPPVPNAVPGDLLVRVIVEPKSGFARKGIDVLTNISVTLKEALLGTEKDIETIHGTMKLKVPSCTKPGQKLSLAKKGAKSPKTGEFGRHIVQVTVDFPAQLTDEQKETIEKVL